MAVILQDRDRAVLQHVARYHMTTNQVLDRLFFKGQVEARKNVVKRLTGEFLKDEQLYQQRKYYRLTPEAARLIGLHEEATKGSGTQAKPIQYGVLSFCCLRGQHTPRYTRPELLADFPDHGRNWLPKQFHYTNFYLDHDGSQARLGQIRVDLGGDYQRLVSVLRELIEEAQKKDGLREIVAEGLFVLGLVTADEQKKVKILEQFQRKPLGAALRIHVVPELVNIIQRETGGEN